MTCDCISADHYGSSCSCRNHDNEISALYNIPIGKARSGMGRIPGKVLPSAVFGLLVIYCLRDVEIFSGSHGIPELISIGIVAALHLWKRQMILSVAGGTICYMVLVQTVFL